MNYSFVSSDNELISVNNLTNELCEYRSIEILNIINTIPHIQWTKTQLMSQLEDYYNNKWNYSYVIKHKEKIIGVLIAYFRIADNRHIFDSLYIHRFAIDKEFQKKGIGTTVIKHFIQSAFTSIPWLLNISLQTNNETSNEYVLKFYRNIGFVDMYKLHYPDKEDIVFLFERKNYTAFFDTGDFLLNIELKHPRLVCTFEQDKPLSVLPLVYFSSSNAQKKAIVEFIFHNYNIEVVFVKLPIDLTEPQVEKADVENERILVSFPLKQASRFITSTPCVIEDTMLFVEFFNRNGGAWELPGLDTKRWLRQMGLNGMLDIMGNTTKRKARFVSQTGAYIKSEEYCYGRGETYGTIAIEKANVIDHKYGTYPYFFHLLFIPEGADKTLAEMDMYEYAQYDYMRKSITELISNMSMRGIHTRPYTILDLLNEGVQP